MEAFVLFVVVLMLAIGGSAGFFIGNAVKALRYARTEEKRARDIGSMMLVISESIRIGGPMAQEPVQILITVSRALQDHGHLTADYDLIGIDGLGEIGKHRV